MKAIFQIQLWSRHACCCKNLTIAVDRMFYRRWIRACIDTLCIFFEFSGFNHQAICITFTFIHLAQAKQLTNEEMQHKRFIEIDYETPVPGAAGLTSSSPFFLTIHLLCVCMRVSLYTPPSPDICLTQCCIASLRLGCEGNWTSVFFQFNKFSMHVDFKAQFRQEALCFWKDLISGYVSLIKKILLLLHCEPCTFVYVKFPFLLFLLHVLVLFGCHTLFTKSVKDSDTSQARAEYNAGESHNNTHLHCFLSFLEVF